MGVMSAGQVVTKAVKIPRAVGAATPLAEAAGGVRALAAKLTFATPAQAHKSVSAGGQALEALAQVAPRGTEARGVDAAAQPVIQRLRAWQSPPAMAQTRVDTLKFLGTPAGRALDDGSLAQVAQAYTRSIRRRTARPAAPPPAMKGAATYTAPKGERLRSSLFEAMNARTGETVVDHPDFRRLVPEGTLQVTSGGLRQRPNVLVSLPEGKTITPDAIGQLYASRPGGADFTVFLEGTGHLRFPDAADFSILDNPPTAPVRSWGRNLTTAQQRTGMTAEGLHRERVIHAEPPLSPGGPERRFGVDFEVFAQNNGRRIVVRGLFSETPTEVLPLSVKLEAIRQLARDLSSNTDLPVEFKPRLAGAPDLIRFVGGREV